MTTLTGGGITLYKWLALRGQIMMAMKGLKSTHFRRLKGPLCLQLGISRRAPLHEMLEATEKRIEEVRLNLKAGEIVE